MRGYSGDERRDPDDSGLPPPSMLATQFPEAPYPLARESKHANADTGEARMRTTLETINHRIGGRDTNGVSQRTGPVWNPATGEKQADVLLAEPADVDAAVQTARKAFLDWRNASSTRRARVMFAFRNLVLKHTRELAEIVTREHGKVVSDAAGEITRGMEVVEFACGIPQLLKGEYSDQVSSHVDSFSFRQPLGVCAGITPFNFPVMVPMWRCDRERQHVCAQAVRARSVSVQLRR